MLQTLVLITSPPHSQEAQRALTLTASLRARGVGVGVVLLQDAVLAAVRPSASPASAAVDTLLSSAVPVYVAEHDLRLRGFSTTGLRAGVQSVNDHGIVDLVMADGTRALGCF